MSNQYSSSKDTRSTGEILEAILGMIAPQVQPEFDQHHEEDEWIVPIFNIPEEAPQVLALEQGASEYTVAGPHERWKHSFVRVLREFCRGLAAKIKDEPIGALRICEQALKECEDVTGLYKFDMFPMHVMQLLETGKYRKHREVAESMEVDFKRQPQSDKETANYRNKRPFSI
jgi:hypothetical protein